MVQKYETLTIECPDPHVLLVTLDRPEVSNAMNTQMGRDLLSLFEPLALDRQDLRCIVITGRGEKTFCAGGDLKERKGMTDAAWRAQHVIFEGVLHAMLRCPVPIIAAVNGAAFGGGCELALACDFVYAAATARFALIEVTLGIIPGMGGTQNLPRAVGERRAKEIILTGAPFTALEAFDWGVVNRVTEARELGPATLSTASRIAANAPIAVRQAKQAISRGVQMSLFDGLAFEIEAYNRTIPTEDRLEGVLAFNERRPAAFRGQ